MVVNADSSRKDHVTVDVALTDQAEPSISVSVAAPPPSAQLVFHHPRGVCHNRESDIPYT